MKDITIDIQDSGDHQIATVKISPALAKKLIQKFWRNQGKIIKLDGFRASGKHKKDEMEKRVGRVRLYHILFATFADQHLVNDAPRKILMTDGHKVHDGGDTQWWMIQVDIWVEPEVKLDGQEMDGLEFNITCIDAASFVAEKMREFAILHPYLRNKVDDKGNPLPAQEGDMVDVAVEAMVDGKKFDSGCEESTNLRLIKGTMHPVELYESLLGKKAGDIVNLKNVQHIPPAFANELQGKSMDINCKINRVYTCEDSAINDDLAITAGFNSLDQWHSNLLDVTNKRISSYKEQMRRTAVIEHLMKHATMPDFPRCWQEIKVKELIDRGEFNKLTPMDKLCSQLNDVTKHISVLKAVGTKHNIGPDDGDKPINLREDGSYAIKVLDYIIGKAKFNYVNSEAKKDGGGDREGGSGVKG